jgi:transposase
MWRVKIHYDHAGKNNMIMLNDSTKIYVYLEPVDMRKAIDGLVYLLVEHFSQSPQSDSVFVFSNKQRNKLKLLKWDKNGFILYYKRLEKGRFQYSKYLTGNEINLTHKELKALLMGLDFYILSEHSAAQYDDFI